MGNPAKPVEKKVIYPEFKMEEKGKLILPPEIISQIQFLHSHCDKDEWSGMLMYDVISGDPSKPEEFELEVKHIFLMDIGTSAATEYEPDGDIVDIYDNIPEAMEWKTGHIHTHHNGSAYFSATDNAELNDNVDKHNYYLSLVVCFDGNYSAKVVFLSEMETTAKMNFLDDSGVLKNFRKKKKEKHMVTIEMRIFYGGIGGFFSDRLKQVQEEKEKKEKALAKRWRYQGGQQPGPHNNMVGFGSTGYRLPAHNQNPIASKVIPDKMTGWEIDTLTRNILMVDPELKAQGNVYAILHQINEEPEVTFDMYSVYLTEHTETVIDNFFDVELSCDEFNIVMKEVIMCIKKFEGVKVLADIVGQIEGTLDTILEEYMLINGEVDNDDEEKDIAEQLEKMERDLI